MTGASALGGVRVVELGTGVSLAQGARHLAVLGAEVVALRPTGRPGGRPDPAFANYLDAGVTVHEVDLAAPAALDLARELCAGADLLMEDLGPGRLEATGLGPDELWHRSPRLAILRVSERGQHGEPRPWSALTRQAAAGWVNRHDSRTDGVPFRAGGSYGDVAIGAFVSAAALSALRAAEVRGVGEQLDLSTTACLHSMLQRTRMRLDYLRELGHETTGVGHQALAVHRCRDGWVGINVLTGQQWSDACLMVGLPEYADKQAALGQDPELRAEFERLVDQWCAEQSRDDVVELGQALRIPVSPLSDASSVTSVGQWQARPFFVPAPGPDGVGVEPGPPWRPSAMPLRHEPPRPSTAPPSWAPRTLGVGPRAGAAADSTSPPLAGVRVVDLGNFYAAPYATQYLGALGADILKIEGTSRPDGFRFVGTSPALGPDWPERSMLFQATNLNKRSASIDLTTAAGRDLVLRLVESADVVVENFSARVMDNFDLGYEVLRARNKQIVVLRLPGYGLVGPWRDFVGFGPGFEQTAALAHVSGFPDERPATPGGYLDPVVGMTAVTAALAALAYRERTGEGQLIEIVQAEVGAGMAAEQIRRAATTGVVAERAGNRSDRSAPQGVYPCRGGTGWLALAVEDDAAWAALVEQLGWPDWARDPALSGVEARLAAHDWLDERLAAWTSAQDGAVLVARLVAAGIDAVEVLAPTTYLEDEHLRAWGYYQPFEHPVTGTRPYPGLPLHAPYLPHHRRRSPLLGEHTSEILSTCLGLDAERLATLAADGVIGGVGLPDPTGS